jgi:hypothetical protein
VAQASQQPLRRGNKWPILAYEEHQKVSYSMLYSSPSHFLKLILYLGIIFKKLLSLNTKKYIVLFINY